MRPAWRACTASIGPSRRYSSGSQVKTDVAEIRMAGRGAQEARSVSADEDGQAFRPGGVTVGGGIRELVPATAERAATAPEDAHHLCRLA